MELTFDQNKKLIEVYPFLQPRDCMGEIPYDYDYSYIRGIDELPNGWSRLFLLYCKDIKPILIKHKYLNNFQFSQIKEKYGRMCLYNMGYPDEMEKITTIYEMFSEHICCNCGKLNKWIWKTHGWIEYLCGRCVKHFNIRLCNRELIYRPDYLTVVEYQNCKEITHRYSYKQLIKEYKRISRMTDEEFFNDVTKNN